jgi:hypothetical protein
MTQDSEKGLKLVIENTTGTHERYIDAAIKANGSVYITYFSDGPGIDFFSGKSDYEAFLSIEAQHKDLLLLHLIKALHGHNDDVMSTITKIANENGIPCSVASY